MFQFPGLASIELWIHSRMTCLQHAGLSHSEIRGSKLVCSSPRLIAAYHVLRRLLMPRHPPCALSNFPFQVAFALVNTRIEMASHLHAMLITLGDTFYNCYGNTQHVKEQPLASLRRSGLVVSRGIEPPALPLQQRSHQGRRAILSREQPPRGRAFYYTGFEQKIREASMKPKKIIRLSMRGKHSESC